MIHALRVRLFPSPRTAGRECPRVSEGGEGRLRQLAATCYVATMTVEEIERAIEKLGARELDRLRVWFEEYQAARFDEKIERDAEAGKLDRLAEQAIDDFRKGRAREL